MEMTCFQPVDNLTFDTVVETRSRLLAQIRQDKTGCICLDLGQVKLCDSAGLAFLIEVKKLCLKYGKILNIREMPAKTEALAVFCGVQSMLQNELQDVNE